MFANLFRKNSQEPAKGKIKLKGFKVSANKDRSKKFGIAASSFEIFHSKIKSKFNLDSFNLFLSDESGLSLLDNEEFFTSLPDQSTIIVAEEGEDVKTDLQIIIEQFRKINYELLQAKDLIHEFLANNRDSDVFKAISHVQGEIHDKIALSLRSEHFEWFEGLDSKLTTKEELMRRKAQDRIRGYFYKTKDELTKASIYRKNVSARKVIDDLLSDFFLFLNGVDYFSCLFDRSHKTKYAIHKDEPDATKITPKRRRIDSQTKTKIGESDVFKKLQVALCNGLGSFACHGIWNDKTCSYSHHINPYSSREAVVLFQIYNLDHQIEISRSIFPSILKSVEDLVNGAECPVHSEKAASISILTYFRELFSIRNLKLVHIVCHDKGTHDELKSKGRVICKQCDEFKQIQKIKLKIL